MNRTLLNLNEIATVQSRELQATMVALRSRVNAIDSTRIDSTIRAMQSTAEGMRALSTELQASSVRFNSLMTKVESGDGSLAKLLNDPALYNDIRRIAFRVDSLMIDFRANPRKYLKFSVF
jgi:phospholipid/cholesterol/gamma-HCH transport system substrate-binding protein